jgi:FAD/FMN-containing dehydrogenase
MAFDGRDSAAAIERWGAIVENAPRELTSFMYVQSSRDTAPLIRLMSVWAGDQPGAAIAALTPMLEIAPLLDQQAALVPYASVVPASDAPHRGRMTLPLISNGFAVHLTSEIAASVAEGVTSGAAPWVAIRAVGGAVNDVAPDATAFAHRHQGFNINSADHSGSESEFRPYWDALRPRLDGLYLSFETDDRPARLLDAFPAETLIRLRELKASYDPGNVFNQNFPIEPRAVPVSRAA